MGRTINYQLPVLPFCYNSIFLYKFSINIVDSDRRKCVQTRLLSLLGDFSVQIDTDTFARARFLPMLWTINKSTACSLLSLALYALSVATALYMLQKIYCVFKYKWFIITTTKSTNIQCNVCIQFVSCIVSLQLLLLIFFSYSQTSCWLTSLNKLTK